MSFDYYMTAWIWPSICQRTTINPIRVDQLKLAYKCRPWGGVFLGDRTLREANLRDAGRTGNLRRPHQIRICS
jgi:hypothetical protein